jgi:putative addiction module component (TIGR02574 family)
MTTTIEKEFRSLTIAERVELVEELWQRISAEPKELPFPNWQIDEVERRRDLYKANPRRAVPWAKAKAQILKHHAKRRRST